MAHRGQWSEHEARGVLSAWRKSGQSLERFAKERGLVPQRIRCVPLDNNASEQSLRRVALGRKNYLFVGDVD